MLAKKVGDWAKVLETFQKVPAQLKTAVKKAEKKEAQFLRTKMVEGLKNQAPGDKQFKPLAATTIAVRKFKGFNGTKALIRTGDLRNSIQVVEAPEGVFVGVHRTARSKDGKSLVDVAVIHEYGAGPIVVKVTPKMRSFLMMAFRQAGLQGPYGKGSGLMITKIPARPFVGPVFEKFGGKGSRDRIEKDLVELMRGLLS